MTTAATPRPLPTAAPPASRVARVLERIAAWLELYAQAALRIARIGTVIGASIAAGVEAFNVFTRYVLGYSLFGADELARYAFIWTIWMGVALAVRSGAAMAITLLVDHGPAWWRRSLRTFSGVALAALLAFACYRATQYATSSESLARPSTLRLPIALSSRDSAVSRWICRRNLFHGLRRRVRRRALPRNAVTGTAVTKYQRPRALIGSLKDFFTILAGEVNHLFRVQGIGMELKKY